jgi:hypothetical protein
MALGANPGKGNPIIIKKTAGRNDFAPKFPAIFSCWKSLTLPKTAIILFEGNFLRKNNDTP